MAKKKEKEEQIVEEKIIEEKESKKITSKLDIVRKSIAKKYGEKVLSFLDDHDGLEIESIPTGCLALDAAIGIGGFAKGRIYEVFGPNSSGKSTLALSICLQALAKGMRVAYVDAEHALDTNLVKQMAARLDISTAKMELVKGYTGEENLQIAEDLIKTEEIDVLVIDSVSSLIPSSESESEIGDDHIGLLARLMSKACRKLTPIANKTNTLVIFINQTRIDIMKYGDKQVPTGGEALKFFASGRIKVTGGESKSSHILDERGEVIGHRSTFNIVKNKFNPPHRTAEVSLIYGHGYDYVAEVVQLSIDLGFINQAGAWFTLDGEKINGKETLTQRFREDIGVYEEYRAKCKKALGLLKDE